MLEEKIFVCTVYSPTVSIRVKALTEEEARALAIEHFQDHYDEPVITSVHIDRSDNRYDVKDFAQCRSMK